MAKLTGDMEVWQANALVEATQYMTLTEKRLLLAAAAVHDPRRPLPASATVDLHVDDFRDVFGLDGSKSVYDVVAKAAKRLYERSIKRRYMRHGKEVVEEMRWVWIARYVKGEGRVSLGFSPSIAPYLTLLHERYTRFKLRHIGQLKSLHSVRMYELMAEYRTAGKREIDLERLRDMLGLADKYTAIDNLRRRVLEPAIEEINATTDLRVTMTPVRRGRTVTGVRFTIRVDDQLSLDLPMPPDPEEPEERVLQGGGSATQEQ